MALSMSVSAGKHNARHNTNLAYRAKLPNVDPKLSHLNFAIRDEPIKEAYNRVFGKSLSDYNDLAGKIEQKRSRIAELDRDIESRERTVARLDRSIETKTKRLDLLTEWLQEAEKKLDGRFY